MPTLFRILCFLFLQLLVPNLFFLLFNWTSLTFFKLFFLLFLTFNFRFFFVKFFVCYLLFKLETKWIFMVCYFLTSSYLILYYISLFYLFLMITITPLPFSLISLWQQSDPIHYGWNYQKTMVTLNIAFEFSVTISSTHFILIQRR